MMKKRKIQNLNLNKNTVSNFQSKTVNGGGVTNSCFPFNCFVEPTCECDGGGEGNITVRDHTCINGEGNCGATATACTFIDC